MMNFKLIQEMELQKWVTEKGLDVVCHVTYIDNQERAKGDKMSLYYNETLFYNKKFIFECMYHGGVELYDIDFTRDELSTKPLDETLTMKEAYPDKLVFFRQKKGFF